MSAAAPITPWLELGLANVQAFPPTDLSGQFALHQFAALLPVVASLARLWGSLDPARASGATAALRNPLLRSAGRAAAVEFAAWPTATVAAALRRAEQDNLFALARRRLDETTLVDLWDEIAVAWARHLPEELPAVYARLHARLRPGSPHGLWRQQIEQRAAARTPWPAEFALPPGTTAAWRRAARWGLTAGTRMRACLALAAAAARDVAERTPRGPVNRGPSEV